MEQGPREAKEELSVDLGRAFQEGENSDAKVLQWEHTFNWESTEGKSECSFRRK